MTSLSEGLMLEDGGVVSLVGAGGKTSLMFRLARELSTAGKPVLTTTTTKIYVPSQDQSNCVVLAESVAEILDRADKMLKRYRHISAAGGRLPESGKLSGLRPEVICGLWKAGLFRWIIVEADGAAGRPLKAPADHEPVIPACTKRLVGLVGLNALGQALTERLVFRPENFARLTGLSPGAEITAAAVVKVLVHGDGMFKSFSPEVKRIAFLNQADAGDNFPKGDRIARLLLKGKKTGLSRLLIGQILLDPPVLKVYDLKPNPDKPELKIEN